MGLSTIEVLNNTKFFPVVILLFVIPGLLLSCKEDKMEATQEEFLTIRDIPQEKWDKLAQKRIFFGHQSVGYNIITGINKIMEENPQIKLNIVKTTDIAHFDGAIFAHDWIGTNMNPQSKTEAFENILNNGVGEKIDIAFTPIFALVLTVILI